jgi:hypothetical protein
VKGERLVGGVANAGSVIREGDHVLRPANPFTPSVHRLLAWLSAAGFNGASVPVGIEADGRERLVFIPGAVPFPPYPEWAQADAALASITGLVRRLHDAARGFDPTGLAWSPELADPRGGPMVCHNDVCLENVVFRDGTAVALLDFDFAAPGRPVYDLAQFARMCVPVDDEANAARLGWVPADRPARLRLVAEAYGLDEAGRAGLLATVDESMARGGEFVRRRVEAGDPNFIKMWNEMGGQERFDRRRHWWAGHAGEYSAALRIRS